MNIEYWIVFFVKFHKLGVKSVFQYEVGWYFRLKIDDLVRVDSIFSILCG